MREKRTRKQWRRQERYLERCRKRQQNGDSKGGISKMIVMFLLFAVAIFGVYIYFGSYEKTTEVVGEANIEPPVEPEQNTTKKVKANIKDRTKKTKILLSKHTIYNSHSSENRNENMRKAAEIINGKNERGYLLKPGEKFSWLEIVGNTTEAKGFVPAPVIYGRRVTLGLGGGVCQVSSAINSAVMAVGIDTYCQKHSLPSSYIHEERGDKEATVSFDSGIDFSFENTLDDPIKIQIIAKGGDVTVKVWAIKYQKN